MFPTYNVAPFCLVIDHEILLQASSHDATDEEASSRGEDEVGLDPICTMSRIFMTCNKLLLIRVAYPRGDVCT